MSIVQMRLSSQWIGAGLTSPVAGAVVNDNGADIALVELITPVLLELHWCTEVFKCQVSLNSHVVDAHVVLQVR